MSREYCSELELLLEDNLDDDEAVFDEAGAHDFVMEGGWDVVTRTRVESNYSDASTVTE